MSDTVTVSVQLTFSSLFSLFQSDSVSLSLSQGQWHWLTEFENWVTVVTDSDFSLHLFTLFTALQFSLQESGFGIGSIYSMIMNSWINDMWVVTLAILSWQWHTDITVTAWHLGAINKRLEMIFQFLAVASFTWLFYNVNLCLLQYWAVQHSKRFLPLLWLFAVTHLLTPPL